MSSLRSELQDQDEVSQGWTKIEGYNVAPFQPTYIGRIRCPEEQVQEPFTTNILEPIKLAYHHLENSTSSAVPVSWRRTSATPGGQSPWGAGIAVKAYRDNHGKTIGNHCCKRSLGGKPPDGNLRHETRYHIRLLRLSKGILRARIPLPG